MLVRESWMPWLNWGIATVYVLFQFFLQATAGLFASGWQADFHLNSTRLGSLSAAFFVSYVILQIPVGLAYDRFGARKILITASILLCLGTFGLGLSQVYWQAYCSRLIMGSGSAFGFVGMLYVTASWFSNRHFILLIGISETLAMVGVALGEVGMAWAISHYGWRITMYVSGVCALLVSLFIVLCVRDPKVSTRSNSIPVISLTLALKKVLTNSQIWLAGLYGFAMFAIVNVVANLWGVPFLIEQYHLPLHNAGLLMAMIFIGIAAGGPINAWLVQQWPPRRRIMTWFAVLTTLLYALFVYSHHLPFWCLYGLLFLLGFFSSSYIQVFGVVKDSADASVRGAALSTTNMILMISAPLLQPLIGKLLASSFSFRQSLSVVLIMLVVAVFLSLKLDKN